MPVPAQFPVVRFRAYPVSRETLVVPYGWAGYLDIVIADGEDEALGCPSPSWHASEPILVGRKIRIAPSGWAGHLGLERGDDHTDKAKQMDLDRRITDRMRRHGNRLGLWEEPRVIGEGLLLCKDSGSLSEGSLPLPRLRALGVRASLWLTFLLAGSEHEPVSLRA
eukprot:g1802.t1